MKSALDQFKEYPEILKESPLEQLRFFCSLAMNPQDWLDSEEFFDAIELSMKNNKKE